jgi:small subunit ribosomal protein S4
LVIGIWLLVIKIKMAYLLGPKEKRSRALGENLFLKAERSTTSKSAYLRRPYRPGVHGKRRSALSEYGLQLREKQKVKLVYGLRERQLKRYVENALKEKTSTPEALARILETRLDSVVFRMGFAPSRSISRALVSHGHFAVNGRRTTIPSQALRPGDKVTILQRSFEKAFMERIRQHLKRYEPPKWLSVDKQALEGTLVRWPTLEELQLPYNLGRLIEFYSK